MTSPLDLRPLLARVQQRIERHALGAPGAFARFARGNVRDRTPDPYGCADAANLLFTLDAFPAGGLRSEWVHTLQSLQDAATGLFREGTHDPIHTTAHVVAALALFDAQPRSPLHALEPLANWGAAETLLDRLDWKNEPWTEAHKGAGMYAALVLTGSVSAAWENAYFAWLAERFDPASGVLRSGCVPPVASAGPELFPHLAGTFHYLFNFEYRGRPLPYPDALVDTCLHIEAQDAFPLARVVWFADVDWVYCLSRASRQTDHRRSEAIDALRRFAVRYVAFLRDVDFDRDDGATDLHRLFGAVCAVAELQNALPRELESDRPLRLVLDRRPFI